MNYDDQIHHIREAVEHALQAVYHTQTNNSSSNYQHSEQLIGYAKDLLHDFKKQNLNLSEDEEKDLLHAKELLRQVEETQSALTFY